jgi:phosphate transport system substrate-binding protein
MIRNLCLAVGVASIALAGVAKADTVSLNGSTTVMNALVMPKKAQIEAASGQQITVVGNGSQRGLADLLAGKAQIGMISAPLDEEVTKINAKQPGSIDPTKLTAHLVGETRVAFAVHPSNPVRTLTSVQLADIFTGTIKNWKDVGGADLPIVVVAAQPGDGVRSMVESKFLKGGDFTKDTRAMSNALQIAKVVAQLPGAIGVLAAVSIDSSVGELKADVAIAQPLILVTTGEETQPVRKVIEAVTQAGKS